MAFKTIELSSFKRSNTKDPEIKFSLSGRIGLTNTALGILGITEGKNNVIFAIDGPKLAITVANKPTPDSVKLRIDPTRSINVGQCSGLVKHLATQLDWPLGKGKLSTIKYTLGQPTLDAGFENPLYLLT